MTEVKKPIMLDETGQDIVAELEKLNELAIGVKGEKGDPGSQVSVSTTGTSTTQAKYITIDGVEYKISGSGGSGIELDEKLLITDTTTGTATINPLYRSGYISVDNVVKRNSIDVTQLEVGTRCYVKNDDKFYKLTISTGTSKVWEDDNETATFDRYASSEKYGTVMIGDNLKTDASGKLVVDVATTSEEGSTKPISAGAVYDILGDIKTRLGNI